MVLEFLQEEDGKEPTFFIDDESQFGYFIVLGYPIAGKVRVEIIDFEHGTMVGDDLIVFDGEGNVLSN